jgi:tetratricopeptide (TPR) repeat protein
MSNPPSEIPSLTPEQRHAVATRYDRAMQLLGGHLPGQALPLLLECCKIDPANPSYRHALRVAQHEQRLDEPLPPLAAWLSSWRTRRRLRKALRAGQWLQVVELADILLVVDPKNAEAHWASAQAFERLGWIDQAVFCLELARIEIAPNTLFDRELIRFYERRGSFTQAEALTAPLPLPADELYTFRRDLVIAEERLLADPNNADLQRIRDRLAHEIHAREVRLLQERADRFPGKLQYRFELGVSLLKAGQFEGALAAFGQAQADESLRWRCLVYAAYCHINRRQWARAKPLLQEALLLIPETEMMRKEVMALLAEKLD